MNVLHLFNEIKFSGAEIMYSAASHEFKKKGINLFAFSTGKTIGDYASVFIKSGIHVEHYTIGTSYFFPLYFSFYFSLIKFIKKSKIDVLHIHRSDLYFPGIIARIMGLKVVKTQHSVFKNNVQTLWFARFQRFILRFFGVHFQSIGKSVYDNELYYYKNPTYLINNWFDSTRFFPMIDSREKAKVRHDLSIDEYSFVIISIGSCTENKNHHDILRAIALLDKKIDILYLHLGDGLTNHDEHCLANDLEISNRIRFLGNIKDVRNYLIASDLFVMTSFYEGLGNSAIEAMACNIPCVLYNSLGLRDLIQRNNLGLLIDQNADKLVESIEFVYKNRDKAKVFASNALVNVNDNYSMDVGIKKLIKIYSI